MYIEYMFYLKLNFEFSHVYSKVPPDMAANH